jgi:2-hydroxychromene-2-carboxylate isomerase
MPSPIEFFFDFSSPYSYLASEAIEALAARHGRGVVFKPTLLGAVFKISGQRPLTDVPLKGDYSRRDFERSARFAGVPFRMPDPFPIATIQAARALLWLLPADPDAARRFLHRAFRAYFAETRNISDAAVLAQVLKESGVDPDLAASAIQQQEVKDRLRAAVDESIARGVFGAPFIFVDNEPFWGNDRLPQVERWLASGPF